MKRVRRGEAANRVYAWRLEWRPLAILAGLFLVGLATILAGFAARSPAAFTAGSVVMSIVSWSVFFWVLVHGAIEYLVWRRTRNVGHRLQFLGAAMIGTTALLVWVPVLGGGWPAVFSPAGIVTAILWAIMLPLGIALAVLGYVGRGFRARDVDVYRNIIVREGERIRELTDGYTERVLALPYPDLGGVDVQSTAAGWAAFLGRAGVSLGYRIDDEGVTVYPVTYTGIGTLRLWTAFLHVYWLLRHPEHLTWVRIGWDRQVRIHVSRYDYARIGRPVAHHLLCGAVADALVTSLLAFSRGNLEESLSIGAGEPAGSRQVRLPAPWHDRAGVAAAWVSTVLVLAGLGSAITAAITSPAHTSLAIVNVEYPATPTPDVPVDVYASLAGLDEFWDRVNWFYIHVLFYFNETGGATMDMRHVEGQRYGIRLQPFPEGTEVRFSLSASVRRSGPSGDGTPLTAGPFTMTVGRIARGGPSGLAIGSVSHEVAPDGNVTFRVPITASALITTAQLLVIIEFVVVDIALTASGGTYEGLVERLGRLPGWTYTVQVLVAAQDATWNSATLGPIGMEVTG